MNKQFNFLVILILILVLGCATAIQTPKEVFKTSNEEVNYIPYYLKVYEADSLYIIGNYQRSFEILDSLFQKYEPLNQDIWYEMETYVNAAYKTNQIEKIKPILSNLIKNWGFNYYNLNEDIKKLNLISEIEINELETKYHSKINWNLRDSIIQMN